MDESGVIYESFETSVRTDNVSAEYFGRVIFWLFWQNKLSGPNSYIGRNAETLLFRQK